MAEALVDIWEAERILGRQTTGRTRPLLVDALLRGQGGHPVERRELLVKAIGLPEITETSLFAEYFGAQLAIASGIDAPAPVLVHMSSELIQASAGNLQEWQVAPQPGRGVGLELLRGMAPLSRLTPTKGHAIADAARIYVFDMLVQNPDRRADNPNCGNHRGRLLAYDHEMAFSFLYPLVGRGEAWEIPAALGRAHIFAASLHEALLAGHLKIEQYCSAVVSMLNERVDAMVEYLPSRWQERGQSVATHIHLVNDHLPEFASSLHGSLR